MNDLSYIGPGLWIRIKHRFGPRMMEWFLAAHMTIWGLVPTFNQDLFHQDAFVGFAMAVGHNEATVGAVMIGFGLLRFIALVINGARKDVTPHIRQFSAGIGFLIWAGITYCYASSNFISTWLAIYPLFAIGELVNIHRAARDQGEARNGRNN
ncbi:hypothetical protein G6L09_05700 [Agrobacterium rhizogenes]|nr:hypothetical protein [Rhizobium rhizogenes]NTH70052.1 hypothetical protein [Rhizobium rhizogenes]